VSRDCFNGADARPAGQLGELGPGAVVEVDGLAPPAGPGGALGVAGQLDASAGFDGGAGAHVGAKGGDLGAEGLDPGEAGRVEQGERHRVGGARAQLRPAARRAGESADEHVEQQAGPEALVCLGRTQW
jgi:hypothetical protein